MYSISLGARKLSADDPCYIIAEIGVNHNGDAALAARLVEAAKKAGADAVKFQTFCTQELIRAGTKKAAYQESATGGGTQDDMLAQLELPLESFAELKEQCDRLEIDFLSTAFDHKSLDAVAALNPKCFKWPSGELQNVPLLRHACQHKKPILLSTGMADLAEVSAAIDVIRQAGVNDIVVMQCVSNYPAEIGEQNLRTLPAMSQAFELPAGFSDHTLGLEAAIAARALGMCVLEKHITLDRTMHGPDHRASTEPAEFAELVAAIRSVERALGDGIKRTVPSEENVKTVARKSLVYAKALKAGHILTGEDMRAKRPGDGLAPTFCDRFVGQILDCDVAQDQLMELSHCRTKHS